MGPVLQGTKGSKGPQGPHGVPPRVPIKFTPGHQGSGLYLRDLLAILLYCLTFCFIAFFITLNDVILICTSLFFLQHASFCLTVKLLFVLIYSVEFLCCSEDFLKPPLHLIVQAAGPQMHGKLALIDFLTWVFRIS